MPGPPGSGPTVALMLPTTASTDSGTLDPSRPLAAAERAEALGFDGVYVGDHLLHPHPMLESVVTLSMVAASTSRVSLGPCVMLFALRHPVLLAKQLATLAAFAPGRLRVGVGVGGEYPAEFEAAGVPLSQRGRRMEDTLRRVRDLMAEGIDVEGLTLGPRVPAVPFLLAGWKEVSLRRAAALGDGWIGYLLGVDSFARRRAFLHECLEEKDRNPETFATGMLVLVHVDNAPGAALEGARAWARLTRTAAEPPAHLVVAGSAEQVADQLRLFWDAGCTEMVLAAADQGDRYGEQVERIGGEILPMLRQFS